MSEKVALVTGATGLLGRQVARAFARNDWTAKGTGFSRADGVSVLKVDLGDAAEVEEALDATKSVFTPLPKLGILLTFPSGQKWWYTVSELSAHSMHGIINVNLSTRAWTLTLRPEYRRRKPLPRQGRVRPRRHPQAQHRGLALARQALRQPLHPARLHQHGLRLLRQAWRGAVRS